MGAGEFPIQKWAIFRKVKSKIPDFERGKSRNYAEAYMWYAAQVIPQIDAEIAEKGHFWLETS
jgi:hypothetical protein